GGRQPGRAAPPGGGAGHGTGRARRLHPPPGGQDPRRERGGVSGTLRRRHNAVLAVVLAVVILFAARLVYVQAPEGPRQAQDPLHTRLGPSTHQACRGDTLDANGEVLATSVQRYNVGVNQLKVRDFVAEIDGEEKRGAVAAAALLAPVLDRDPAELGAQLVGDS